MASVIVRGTAAASVTPDRAQLSLEVAHRAADAAAALDEVAAMSARLLTVLESHGLDRTAWATDGVQVGEEYQWRDNQQVMTGFRAVTGVTVTLAGADLVGAIVRDAVGQIGAGVRNLVWKVDRENPARRALLAAAALDARVRAASYADALGLRLGEVELISETPIVPDSPQPRMMAAMDSAKVGGTEVEVSGGLVELTADVHVRFALLA
ncbi:MAG: hypothetical protein RJA49_2819 [Actinomycetota bacterium]|jgi:uncharacterized protein YggE